VTQRSEAGGKVFEVALGCSTRARASMIVRLVTPNVFLRVRMLKVARASA